MNNEAKSSLVNEIIPAREVSLVEKQHNESKVMKELFYIYLESRCGMADSWGPYLAALS